MAQLLILVSVCLAVAAAQVPHRCVTPQAWEGRLMQHESSRGVSRLAKLSYDAFNQRLFTREEVHEEHRWEPYDELYLGRERVMYRINPKTRSCTRIQVHTDFRPIEVPANATFYGSGYIGTSSVLGAGILVDLFGGDTPRGRYAGSWTSVGCVPVSDVYVTSSETIAWNFFDVTLGISDPNVFIPPKECLQ